MAAHGFERATRDIDIVYSTAPSSCSSLASVLEELRAEVVFADEPEGAAISGEVLQRGGHFRFSTEAGPLDAMSQVSGFDFPRLQADAIGIRIDDFELLVCSYDALIAMKSATGRARDLEDLQALREVQSD